MCIKIALFPITSENLPAGTNDHWLLPHVVQLSALGAEPELLARLHTTFLYGGGQISVTSNVQM